METNVLLCSRLSVRCPQGVLTFDGDATFTGNEVVTDDSDEQGRAGAISNVGSGSIMFKGKLTMEDNNADVSVVDMMASFFSDGE